MESKMLVAVLSLMAATPAVAQSNMKSPCSGYTTPEADACAEQHLEAANADLMRYTAAARKHAQAVASNNANAGEAGALIYFDKSVAAWEAYRDAERTAVASEYAGGTISGYEGTECAVRITQLRTHTIWEEWLVALDGSTNMAEPPLPKPIRVRPR
ncbi:lysozyme inhibitor LprI family protein [uncultured Sphingomonas sp.]|uniref:lysozyme inhibitor LprI family protein n=1 Tax=uncultured Sphingomonas sp. TaxID=158754 RepID=UPI0035CAB5F6